MGYIAPIIPFSYMQYGERDIVHEHDPFHLGPVEAALIQKQSFMPPNFSYPRSTFNKKKRQIHPSSVKNSKCVDKAFAEISGKGQNFNESV